MKGFVWVLKLWLSARIMFEIMPVVLNKWCNGIFIWTIRGYSESYGSLFGSNIIMQLIMLIYLLN